MSIAALPSRSFLICLALLMVTALITPRALSFLPSLGGLGLLLFAFIQYRTFIRPPMMPTAFFGATIALVATSSMWAIAPVDAWERAGKLIPLLGFGLFWLGAAKIFDQTPDRTWVKVLCLAYIAAAIGLSIERFFDLPITHLLYEDTGMDIAVQRLNRSLVVLAMLIVPMLALAHHTSKNLSSRRYWQGALLLALIVGLLFCRSQTAQLAALVGLLFYAAAPVSKLYFWRGLGVLIIACVMLSPWVVNYYGEENKDAIAENLILMEASIPHRLEIWHFVAKNILEKPLTGYGIEATRYMYSEQEMEYMAANNVLHPHNATLQAWVELGLMGAFLMCALLLAIMAWCRNCPGIPAQRIALATFMAALCMANTGYGLWQGWQLGLFIFLAGLTIYVTRARTIA